MACREVVSDVTEVTAHVKEYWTISTTRVWLNSIFFLLFLYTLHNVLYECALGCYGD